MDTNDVENNLIKIEQEVAAIAEQSKRSYFELVKLLASGSKPDGNRVAKVLKEAGKKMEDLRRDIRKVQEQNRIRADTEKLPAMATRKKEILSQMAIHDETFRIAEENHQRDIDGLRWELLEIEEEVKRIEEGARAYSTLHIDSDLLDILANKQKELERCRSQLAQLQRNGHQPHVQARLKPQIEELEQQIGEIEKQSPLSCCSIKLDSITIFVHG